MEEAQNLVEEQSLYRRVAMFLRLNFSPNTNLLNEHVFADRAVRHVFIFVQEFGYPITNHRK